MMQSSGVKGGEWFGESDPHPAGPALCICVRNPRLVNPSSFLDVGDVCILCLLQLVVRFLHPPPFSISHIFRESLTHMLFFPA